MTAITPKPLPIPGGSPLPAVLAKPLVLVDAETTYAVDRKHGLFSKPTRESVVATGAAGLNIMPVLTSAAMASFDNPGTLPTGPLFPIGAPKPPLTAFLQAAGTDFEAAITKASALSSSAQRPQPIAIVQARDGVFQLAPVGSTFVRSGTFTWNGGTYQAHWNKPFTPAGFSDASEWKRPFAGEKGDKIVSSSTRITALRAGDPAVKAVVVGDGWYDLRSGSANVS